MIFATAAFVLSIIGIATLFAMKYREVRRDEAFTPLWRERADARALKLKGVILDSRYHAAKLPPLVLRIIRTGLHEGALGLAALGRIIEREAHRLADYVSYKRGFERKETKSEFLKRVTEHKNGHAE